MTPELLDAYRAHVKDLDAAVRSILAKRDYEGLVIHSGTPVKRSRFDDQYWPSRPVPAFAHWAHMPSTESFLYVPAVGATRIVSVVHQSFWEAPPEPDWDAITSALEVDKVDSFDAAKGRLPSEGRVAFVGEALDRATAIGIEPNHINPPRLMEALDELRVRKSDFETACIREANIAAARGHRSVEQSFRDGERSELALHLRYLEASGQDAFDTPYQNIVALGRGAAVLHYVSYQAAPKSDAASLLIDAGAQFLGYSSDITRTHVDGSASEPAARFQALVDAIDGLQKQICDEIRVGRPYEELHNRCHELLASVLVDAGLVRDISPEGVVKTGISRKLLPHGLGHSLGLQTHDVGCRKLDPEARNPFLRNTSDVTPGQVFTIEPGLYFIDALLDELKASEHASHIAWGEVEALRVFGGIRIEDNISVLEDGIENLTRDAFDAQ